MFVKSIDLLDNEYVRKAGVVLGASERKYMHNQLQPILFRYGNAGLAQKPFALYIVKEVEIWDNESG
jgi:hypothetical protein